MISQARLMAIFKYLSAENSSVKLFNTYRGLPLDSDSAILGVDQGNIIANVYGYQAASMALEGQTHLHVPTLPGTLRATVVEVDIKKKKAVLSDFTDIEGAVGKRRLVRVEPSETLEVILYDGRQRIGGKVIDLSSEGMCIYTLFANLYGLKFEHDKEVYIDFKPLFAKETIRSKGIITSLTSQEGSFSHRLGLKVHTSPDVQPLLDEYIHRRQKELMNEMEQHYLSLSRKKTRRV
jgi:PilZ domain